MNCVRVEFKYVSGRIYTLKLSYLDIKLFFYSIPTMEYIKD